MSEVIEIESNRFNEVVGRSHRIVLIEFFAPWCGPCRSLTRTIREIASEFAGRIEVYKVNIDAEPDLAEQFDASSVPTVVFLRNGRELGRFFGAVPKRRLVSVVSRLLGGEGTS